MWRFLKKKRHIRIQCSCGFQGGMWRFLKIVKKYATGEARNITVFYLLCDICDIFI